jgi:hypothetical protein
VKDLKVRKLRRIGLFSAEFAHLEILRRPAAFRASRSNAFGGSG